MTVNLVVSNVSDLWHRRWVPCSIPKSVLMGARYATTSQGFEAFWCRDVGDNAIFAVHAVSDPGGLINDLTLEPQPAAPVTQFRPSAWVADKLEALIPRFYVKLADGTLLGPKSETIKILEDGPGRQVWHLQALHGNGWISDVWSYIYRDQDVIDVEMQVRWSDRDDEAWSTQIGQLYVKTGELLTIDDARRVGAEAPFESGGQWFTVLSGPRDWGDAHTMRWTGRLLCLPQVDFKSVPPERLADHVQNLVAAQTEVMASAPGKLPRDGRMFMSASRKEWYGNWLVFGEIPHWGANPRTISVDPRWDAYRQASQFAGDPWQARPLGLAVQAGTTGGQEDFGASKGGWTVYANDPRWIGECSYSLSDFFRGFQHVETDGRELTQADHPGRITWSGLNDPRTSQDLCGKSKDRPYSIPGSGHTGIDNQHRSQNNALAYFALTGSYQVEAMFESYLETDLAQMTDFLDSPRAWRMVGVWANLSKLLKGPAADKATQRLREHADLCLSRWLGGKFTNQDTHPVRIIETGGLPSWTDKPVIVVWEHSIASTYIFAAYLATRDERYLDLAIAISRMVVEVAEFRIGGKWMTATSIVYRDGEAEGLKWPDSEYAWGSANVLPAEGEWWNWIAPANLVLIRALNTRAALNGFGTMTPGEQAALQKAQDVYAAIYPEGPANEASASWLAI